MLGGAIGQQHLGLGHPIGDGRRDKAQRFHRSHHGGAGQRYLCEQKNSAKSSAKKRIFM
ncbi:hypothetical protein TUM9839_17420 [Klebsiella pneumoniae subsp. pneumoniae]|nr:hypothetical protein TUM9839_17420 [Klebsiella pneumoniae subsp. pneumoniae]